MSGGSVREIFEGRQEQGINEEVTYRLTVPASWGTPQSSPAPVIKVESLIDDQYADVTPTVMPSGSPVVDGQVIRLPEIKALTENVAYRVAMLFSTVEGDVKDAYAWIDAKR